MAIRAIKRYTPRLVRSATRTLDRFAQRNVMRFRDKSFVADGHVDVLVNFPDRLVNVYQIRQWYGPLEWLSKHHSVAVLCYNPVTAKVVQKETSLRVILTPTFSDISAVQDTIKPDVVLYPNQNYLNHQLLGYADAVHAFICHGESDKIYMASNWLKGFDYFLIAGEASRQRILRNLLNYDVDARTLKIGRPQVDIHPTPMLDRAPGRVTVLYAPTWEGGRKSMSYGSVLSHGSAIMDALLADPKYRVIYRPHPRTGIRSQEERYANEELKDRLQSVIDQQPELGHMIDDSPFGWQLDSADVMITDISAVAYDWLTTAKPLIMTRPAEPAVPVSKDGLVGALDLLPAAEASQIGTWIDRELNDTEHRAKREDLADFYYGDRTPGQTLERFRTAIDQMIDESRAWKGRPGATDQPRVLHPATAQTVARNYRHSLSVQLSRKERRDEGWAAVNRTLSERPAKLVLDIMGRPEQAHHAKRYLRLLEELDRRPDWSVAIVCGEIETFHEFRQATGLRVFFTGNTLRAELVMDALHPVVTLHATQDQKTLRETTYRDTTHAYLGDPNTDDWVNNRLRDFDAVIAPYERQTKALREFVRPLPTEVHVYQLDADTHGNCASPESALKSILEKLAAGNAQERVARSKRRSEGC